MSTENVSASRQSRQAILELLPGGSPLHRYVQWACSAHGSPPIYHLGCVISTLLYELSWRGFRLPKIVDEGEYPLTAQFLLLGKTHTGKNTAFFAMQDFVHAVWAGVSTRPETEPWVEIEGSIEGITSALQDRYIERLDSTPVVLFDPEISKVFARREPLTELLCKLADARTIQLNYRSKQRKARDPNADRIVNPRVCGVFCTTEAQLGPHFKDQHRMGGIFPRMIWLRPEFGVQDIWLAQDHESAKPLRTFRTDAINEWIGWIVQLEMAARDGQGFAFVFTAEAHAVLNNDLFVPFTTDFTSGDDDNLHGVKMRLIEKARVFAVLHAALDYRTRVIPDDVHFASKLVKLFLSMLTENTVVRDLGASDDFRAAKRVEGFIAAAGDNGLLKRELYIKSRLSKAVLDAALDQLLDQETVFQDNSQLARAGRYLHCESPKGRELRAIIDNQRTEASELGATLGRGTWHNAVELKRRRGN